MSDTDIDSSSVISLGNISVFNEINDLIERCEELNEYINNSFTTINNIKSQIINHQNIIVTYNDLICDFDNVLQIFHLNALKKIDENKPNSFGNQILNELDKIYFH